jgi:hypothetical protein
MISSVAELWSAEQVISESPARQLIEEQFPQLKAEKDTLIKEATSLFETEKSSSLFFNHNKIM